MNTWRGHAIHEQQPGMWVYTDSGALVIDRDAWQSYRDGRKEVPHG